MARQRRYRWQNLGKEAIRTQRKPRDAASKTATKPAKPRSALRMSAKFPGFCHVCARPYAVGDPVLLNPPKGKRTRWLVRHPECGAQPPRGRSSTWRTNSDWMTADQYAVLEDAMSKQAPARRAMT